MASTRLTNHIRDSLMNSLLQRAFKAKGEDLIERCADYAERLYRDAMGSNLLQINALPEGWLPTDDDIKVQLGGEFETIYFSGALNRWALPEVFRRAGVTKLDDRRWKRFPNKWKGSVVKQYPGDHAVVGEFQKLDDDWNELETEMERARKVALAAMSSVSTVKKLIDIWPEVEEFAKHYLVDGERKAILPAISRDQLNTMLNLPPEEKINESGTREAEK
jgi:hypothetical protein